MPPAAVPPLLGRALAALALTGAVLLAGIGPALAQDPAVTTVPPTSGVLVPGSVPPTTAGPAPTTTEAPAAEGSDDGGIFGLDLDANEKVWVIVGGLVALAVVLLILTIVYWRHTRPTSDGGDRRQGRAGRREDKAARKDEKRQRRRAERDPFTDEPPAADAGPMDLDDLLGTPDPSRSVFGQPDEPHDPGR